MVLKLDKIIDGHEFAYHVSGTVVDDIMPMCPNRNNSYIGQMVNELIRDGWSFVCSARDYKMGDKIDFEPEPILKLDSSPLVPPEHQGDKQKPVDWFIDLVKQCRQHGVHTVMIRIKDAEVIAAILEKNRT